MIKLKNNVEISSTLYKYFKIDNNLYNSIVKGYLWFSNPTVFNDPYDCNIYYDFYCTEEELRNYYISIIEKYKKLGLIEYSNIDIEKRINDFKYNPKKFIEEVLNENKKFINDTYGICCFSEECKNLLMWSHYADKHEGLCLAFHVVENDLFFDTPFKVDYPDNYPKINYIREHNRPSSLQFQLATKSTDWKYENEVRVIKSSHLHSIYRGAIKFDKNLLVEVIFGYRTQNKIIEEFIELFNILGYKVEYHKMTLIENEFGLIKNRINVG